MRVGVNRVRTISFLLHLKLAHTYLESERSLPFALSLGHTCLRVEVGEKLAFERVVRVQRHCHGRRRACKAH